MLTKQVSNTKSVVHLQQICHRDLKLENTLLDGSPAPRLKICDFGYSKVPCFPSRSVVSFQKKKGRAFPSKGAPFFHPSLLTWKCSSA